jgi:hypothetical protein
MKYNEFLTCVESRVQQCAEDGCKVTINHVIKNNGCELDGLVIMHEGQSIAPTIYMNEYYYKYLDGTEMDDVVHDIMERYDYSLDNMCFNYDDIGDFSNYEVIRNKVVYRLVNYEKNRKLLDEVPYFKILDLAIIYYCYCGSRNGTSGYALIKDSNLKMWGISQDVLHKDAVRNTPALLECVILGMSEALRKMMDGACDYGECAQDAAQLKDFLEDYEAAYEEDMYVLTNRTMLNGAGTMMYGGVLDSIAEKLGSDIYILPSSIHELILVPARENFNVDELKQMVCQVNDDEVSENEVLSDSVYLYSRDAREIKVVA